MKQTIGFIGLGVRGHSMAAHLLATADILALDTPGLDLVLTLYRRLAAAGDAEAGTQALYRLYDPDTPTTEAG